MEDKTVLTEKDIRENMPDGWEYRGNALHKSWHFKKFRDMPGFVIRAVHLMNDVNHHADISMDTKAKTVSVSVTAHSEGRATRADIQFAQRLNSIGF